MYSKLLTFLLVFFVSLSAAASPDIKQWTSHGAKVLYVYAPELPMVDINVVFNAGAARDAALPGTARMTIAMLDEGAAGMNADQIASAFADVGAVYGVSSERDMAVVSLRSLTDDKALNSALKTFTTVLTHPEFPEASFQRIQQQTLRGLQAEQQSPGAIAARKFNASLYADHPYATMPVGDNESVVKITPADLKQFYQQYYVSNNAVVVIVGDVEQKQAEQMAEQLLSGLKAGKKAADIPVVEDLKQAETFKIEHPSTQTTILMGQVGISRHDLDYFALYVGNHILGGSGLVSRLSDEVREKRGLSYSVYSYFRPMLKKGPYQFGLQTRNDQAEQALQVMKDTLNTFIENGPSEKELVAAKQNITGGFALRVDSNSEIASYLAMIGFYDLPLDYLDTFNDHINAVTVADIKDAFARRVDTNKMITVLVGG